MRPSFRSSLLAVLNRSARLRGSAYAVDDMLKGLALALGRIQTRSGTRHSTLGVEESIRYIEEVVADYRDCGGFEHFKGRVAELGPGDNVGVALLMRASGADQVDLVDRFFSRRDPKRQARVYEHLSRSHQVEIFRRGAWEDAQFDGITWHTGRPAEAFFRSVGQPYDFILSRAVMEHLYDPIGALRHMVDALAPGGRLLHAIDLRDHGMFSERWHELTFLTFSRPFYKLMVRNSGRPNRVLLHRYREALEQIRRRHPGLRYRLLVTHLVAVGPVKPHIEFEEVDSRLRRCALSFVEQHRVELCDEFSSVADQDLAVSGVFLVLRRAE